MYNKLFGAVCICTLMAAGAAIAGAKTDPWSSSHLRGAAGPVAEPTPEIKSPAYLYKGIAIGATADEVRKKLGDPKERSDPQDQFIFSDEESAQFIYDADHKVSAIMVTFSGKMTGAPSAKDVFGEEVAPKPDGGVFKMVRYPKAGYWISYNKIVGDDSIVSIAMQKI